MQGFGTEAIEVQVAVPLVVNGTQEVLPGAPVRSPAGAGDVFRALFLQQVALGGNTVSQEAGAGGVAAAGTEGAAGKMGRGDRTEGRAGDLGEGAAVVDARAKGTSPGSSSSGTAAKTVPEESGHDGVALREIETAKTVRGGAGPVAVQLNSLHAVAAGRTADRNTDAAKPEGNPETDQETGPTANVEAGPDLPHPEVAGVRAEVAGGSAAGPGRAGADGSPSEVGSAAPELMHGSVGVDVSAANRLAADGTRGRDTRQAEVQLPGPEIAERHAVGKRETEKSERAQPSFTAGEAASAGSAPVSGMNVQDAGGNPSAGGNPDAAGGGVGAVSRSRLPAATAGKESFRNGNSRRVDGVRVQQPGAGDRGAAGAADAVEANGQVSAKRGLGGGALAGVDRDPDGVAAAVSSPSAAKVDGSALRGPASRDADTTRDRSTELRSAGAAVPVDLSSHPGVLGGNGMMAMAHTTVAAGESQGPGSPQTGTAQSGHTAAVAFERMDGAAAPRVIESAPQRLAVGVRDAGLGWVEIRTHAAGGQIGAVVGTGSAASHQALAEELPSMREYLAGQQVKVGHLAAENFSAMGGGQRGSGGQGSGHASTGSQNSGNQNSGSHDSASQGSGNAVQDVARRVRAEGGVQAVFAGGGMDETLSYISVRV